MAYQLLQSIHIPQTSQITLMYLQLASFFFLFSNYYYSIFHMHVFMTIQGLILQNNCYGIHYACLSPQAECSYSESLHKYTSQIQLRWRKINPFRFRKKFWDRIIVRLVNISLGLCLSGLSPIYLRLIEQEWQRAIIDAQEINRHCCFYEEQKEVSDNGWMYPCAMRGLLAAIVGFQHFCSLKKYIYIIVVSLEWFYRRESLSIYSLNRSHESMDETVTVCTDGLCHHIQDMSPCMSLWILCSVGCVALFMRLQASFCSQPFTLNQNAEISWDSF